MKQIPMWEAFDGSPFKTEVACAVYERDNATRILATILGDCAPDEIETALEAAVSRADLTLADAIENVAKRIKRVRLASGKPGDAVTSSSGGTADDGDEARSDEGAG